MPTLTIEMPDEAWELLEMGAQRAQSQIAEFAFFALCSVLANYAVEVELEENSRVLFPADNVPDPDRSLDALAARMVFLSDLTP
ncbi:MAG TPA: hypothetical protein VIH42_15030 [Thermoguttaceae bacterium]